MARSPRIERAGAWHHVTARGHERRAIYRDERDRRRFCQLLGETVELFGWRLHACVLMDKTEETLHFVQASGSSLNAERSVPSICHFAADGNRQQVFGQLFLWRQPGERRAKGSSPEYGMTIGDGRSEKSDEPPPALPGGSRGGATRQAATKDFEQEPAERTEK